MMSRRSLRRAGLAVAATGTAAVLAAAPAMAHHCFIPMYSLDAPASTNWFPLTAEDGAGFEGYVAECDAAVDAGYAALHAAGLPVGIKIFEKLTIGDPKHTGRTNPNGADGHGLEYFGAGSTLADEMVATWIEGAQGATCEV